MPSYEFALEIHSLLRLALTLLCVWVLWNSLLGWLGRRPGSLFNKLLVLLAMIVADVQLLVGLLLYFGLSPITSSARNDMGAAMKDPTLRYFAVEHAGAMLLAVVSLHVGKVSAAKAAKLGNDAGSYRRLVGWFGLALLLIVVMSPWPFSSVVRPLWRFGQP